MLYCMPQVYILLHDIRSVHNVGSIFRTGDAAGVSGIFLSGHSPTPLDRFGVKRNDVAKVALGAEETIPWRYESNPQIFIEEFRKQWGKGGMIIALEQNERSVDYKDVSIKDAEAVLFIFGNEVGGVSAELFANLLDDLVGAIEHAGEFFGQGVIQRIQHLRAVEADQCHAGRVVQFFDGDQRFRHDVFQMRFSVS